jgi:hypothetical protein
VACAAAWPNFAEVQQPVFVNIAGHAQTAATARTVRMMICTTCEHQHTHSSVWVYCAGATASVSHNLLGGLGLDFVLDDSHDLDGLMTAPPAMERSIQNAEANSGVPT